ncbi:hypothetical protein BC941DRAFT_518283 [Chlamydoabsidia padenii]|nr:hypothetical protein BC941DRAFT_518283 [Chlamydoabsidia padenii]
MDEPNTSTICKICLEKDEVTELISPCKCSGSIKYVHPHCMKSWRTSLLQCGRERDVYKCTLCQHKLTINQRNPLRTLLNYKVARIIGTLLILWVFLIPTGTLMKMIIHFSALLMNDPSSGGWSQAWSNGRLFQLVLSSARIAFHSMLNNTLPTHVNYSPFAVCDTQPTDGAWMSHSIIHSKPIYAICFPFFDDRLWQFLLCRLEHFHLGFFLFGSIANIWYTCHILNDMFDIVFMSDTQDFDMVPPQSDIQETRLGMMTRQGGKLVKRLLVTYCCMLVALFWIHFNLLAFVESSSTSSSSTTTLIDTTTKGSSTCSENQKLQQQQQYQPTNQFLVELPLWTLRWVTLGVAVGSVMAKVIYPWLGRLTSCIDHETILSIPSDD